MSWFVPRSQTIIPKFSVTFKNNISFLNPGLFLCLMSSLSLAAYFPALGTGCLFSRPYHRLRVFPPLGLAACFPALCATYMFSRPWYWLHLCKFSMNSNWLMALFAFPALRNVINFRFSFLSLETTQQVKHLQQQKVSIVYKHCYLQ